MTDFCIFCECEPIDPTGWVQRDDSEWVCPWCIKEKANEDINRNL